MIELHRVVLEACLCWWFPPAVVPLLWGDQPHRLVWGLQRHPCARLLLPGIQRQLRPGQPRDMVDGGKNQLGGNTQQNAMWWICLLHTFRQKKEIKCFPMQEKIYSLSGITPSNIVSLMSIQTRYGRLHVVNHCLHSLLRIIWYHIVPD